MDFFIRFSKAYIEALDGLFKFFAYVFVTGCVSLALIYFASVAL